MIDFRFPLVLYVYIPLFILWIFWIYKGRKQKILSDTESHLRARLLGKIEPNRIIWKERLLFLSTVVLVFAASGPQIGVRLAPVDRKGVDLVFAIDVSTSMNAEDVKPNRLEKSKFEISQMIRQLKGDRVALIVFAGSSHLYLPLTTDYEAARLFLDEIDTKMIPTQGTALSSAIQTGLSAFTEDDSKYKVLVLVTDGEDHEGQAIDLASQAAKRGMVVHSVGVGTQSGSLIPVKDKQGIRDYKRDGSGKLITSILNENILRDIAHAGNGTYVRFDNKPANFRAIMKAIDSMEKRTFKSHVYSEYEDRYQSFAILSIGLMLAGIMMPTRNKKEEEWRGRFVK
ncbi:MAG: VWA domain-containing protein [Candidatus Marinimicrobia bacterium]|jgi:Ca-activated chloride channel family protein|nr:VWA domain-containing protein [Candidatus Neomarinimicrobiota bacterium]MBT3677073.1 VWA domain-containing protein [Candidatus Neomarinimicrobiota bacterium]MBT3762372.1 VWA domain-containing protein [Candidatus Neomarinimicrobiota bacterium]MBT4069482.1 VWA domain-containing protein [Candidatus Neomarinimicrobiota bacterium]MBT4270512.1 VWA domain-containing protein [Candidatus Neomarinimicrobiota bacterium]